MVMPIQDSDNDEASFDQLVKKAEEAAHGDEKSKLDWLTAIVIENFVEKAMQRKEEAFPPPEIPKKSRNSRMPVLANNVNKALKKPCFVDDDDDDQKPPSKKQKRIIRTDNNEPHIPEEFRNVIDSLDGTDIMLVIEKELTTSDMSVQQNRFSAPRKQVRADFLTDEEKLRADRKEEMEVLMIQPCLQQATGMRFRKWVMDKTFSYCLNGKWFATVVSNQRNQLEKGSLVQLWKFRTRKESGSKLGFALVNLNLREGNCSGD